jgi:hypothetical protein
VAVGVVFLIVPGVVLFVALAFWFVYVAVEDESFVDGFRDSWALTRGEWLDLTLLLIGVVLVAAVVNAAFALPRTLLDSILLWPVEQAGGALTSVFGLAVLGRTYVSLREREGESEAEESVGDGEGAGESPAPN